MTVKVQRFARLPRTMRYVPAGVDEIPCDVVQEWTEQHTPGSVPIAFAQVRLLSAAGGYKAGHLLTVGASRITRV